MPNITPTLALLALVPFASAHNHEPEAQPTTVQEQLGYPADAKLLIIHADDLGLAHSKNLATFHAMEEGVVTSASVMMTTPWVLEVAHYAQAHPEADLGVHLTLTSEWETYKNGPLAGRDQVPSLVTEHGYFHATVADFAAAADIDQIETEARAQIKAAADSGIAYTHLDGHMGSMLATDEIAQLYIRLGQEYRVPIRLHQHHADAGSPKLQAAAVAMPGKLVQAYGAVPADYPEGMGAHYDQILRDLQPGLNILVLHLGYDDLEMQAITVNHPLWGSHWRQIDYDWATAPETKALIQELGITLLDWREVQEKLFD
ncbi:YdjC-like protein [Verrucomicrobiia bacterium DG1235]|nr:YdjC-like protein [Verrucomicrobiae bacterium DG1235]